MKVDAGLLATELEVEFHGFHGVAALQQVAELLGQVGVVQVAALHEGRKGIVVEDGRPGVAVVAGIVARGEDVLEVGALVAADDFGDEADACSGAPARKRWRRWAVSGDAVVVHIEQRGGQQLGVDEALAVGLGGGNLLDQGVGDGLAGLVVAWRRSSSPAGCGTSSP